MSPVLGAVLCFWAANILTVAHADRVFRGRPRKVADYDFGLWIFSCWTGAGVYYGIAGIWKMVCLSLVMAGLWLYRWWRARPPRPPRRRVLKAVTASS